LIDKAIGDGMPLYRINGKIILFIHIPKTGGTSIERALQEEGPEALFNSNRIAGLQCPPQHFHGDILSNIIGDGFIDYAFCVVRNPIDRIVSEFFYLTQHAKIRTGHVFDRRKISIYDADQGEVSKQFSRWCDRVF
jgi:hypothetical protein